MTRSSSRESTDPAANAEIVASTQLSSAVAVAWTSAVVPIPTFAPTPSRQRHEELQLGGRRSATRGLGRRHREALVPRAPVLGGRPAATRPAAGDEAHVEPRLERQLALQRDAQHELGRHGQRARDRDGRTREGLAAVQRQCEVQRRGPSPDVELDVARIGLRLEVDRAAELDARIERHPESRHDLATDRRSARRGRRWAANRRPGPPPVMP